MEQNFAQTRQKSRDKSEEVLDIATEYFLTHGYDGASINAMARASGISKESIYRYFSSKEDLFEAVIDRQLEVYQERMQIVDMDYKNMDLIDALTRVAETILEIVISDRSLAMRRLLFQMTARGSDVGKHYYKIGPDVAFRELNKIFDYHKDRIRLKPKKLAEYFIASVLYFPMLERECGMSKPLTRTKIKRLVRETVNDFATAYLSKAT